MFLIMKVLMHIEFIETLENTEKYRKETREGLVNDVDLIQQPIVSNILWIHQKTNSSSI